MKRIAFLVSALALSGCVSLLPEPPPAPRLFVLEALETAPAAGQRLDAVIAVARPEGERTLLGDELVWRSGDEIAFVNGASWAGRAQSLLHAMLIETLARQERLAGVARTSEARADYELRWDLMHFEVVEADGAALFAAHVNLIDARTRAVVASDIIEGRAELSGRSASGAANALARAAQEGGARIASFAFAAIESAQASAVSTSR